MNVICVCQKFFNIVKLLKVPYKSVTINRRSPLLLWNMFEIVSWSTVENVVIDEPTDDGGKLPFHHHSVYRDLLTILDQNAVSLKSFSLALRTGDVFDRDLIIGILDKNPRLKKISLSWPGISWDVKCHPVYQQVERLELRITPCVLPAVDRSIVLTPVSKSPDAKSIFEKFPNLSTLWINYEVADGFWNNFDVSKKLQLRDMRVRKFVGIDRHIIINQFASLEKLKVTRSIVAADELRDCMQAVSALSNLLSLAVKLKGSLAEIESCLLAVQDIRCSVTKLELSFHSEPSGWNNEYLEPLIKKIFPKVATLLILISNNDDDL
jgi:hypothetical protein